MACDWLKSLMIHALGWGKVFATWSEVRALLAKRGHLCWVSSYQCHMFSQLTSQQSTEVGLVITPILQMMKLRLI